MNQKLLLNRTHRTGDGSHPLYDKDQDKNNENGGFVENNDYHGWSRTCWGWGDKSISENGKAVTETILQTI